MYTWKHKRTYIYAAIFYKEIVTSNLMGGNNQFDTKQAVITFGKLIDHQFGEPK